MSYTTNPNPMYPQPIDPIHVNAPPVPSSASSSLYPTIDMNDLRVNLFPNSDQETAHGSQSYVVSAPLDSTEETLLTISGAIINLIDKSYSVELSTGDLRIHRLIQGDNIVAVLATVGDVQWPLTVDVASVKLDSSHYFFSFKAPRDVDGQEKETKGKKGNKKEKEENEMLSYGLTIVSKGQERLIKEFDGILEIYSNFSVQKVEEKAAAAMAGVAAREITAGELKADEKNKKEVEGQSAAYWTTLAPNVEDYSGKSARLIATGSGKMVKGILWCGDVTVDRLNWGNEVLKKRIAPGANQEIDPKTLKRIKRAKRVTKMTEKVATGVLSGAVKVSGLITGPIANSEVGKKFFNHLPGEIVLASLDGFSKVCDAVEVAGKNVMSTSSTVTTGLVYHRYGEEAGKVAHEGLETAGHAMGTAWTVFKIRKALNPKSVLKPTTLAKSAAKAAASEMKTNRS